MTAWGMLTMDYCETKQDLLCMYLAPLELGNSTTLKLVFLFLQEAATATATATAATDSRLCTDSCEASRLCSIDSLSALPVALQTPPYPPRSRESNLAQLLGWARLGWLPTPRHPSPNPHREVGSWPSRDPYLLYAETDKESCCLNAVGREASAILWLACTLYV